MLTYLFDLIVGVCFFHLELTRSVFNITLKTLLQDLRTWTVTWRFTIYVEKILCEKKILCDFIFIYIFYLLYIFYYYIYEFLVFCFTVVETIVWTLCDGFSVGFLWSRPTPTGSSLFFLKNFKKKHVRDFKKTCQGCDKTSRLARIVIKQRGCSL